MMRKRVRINIHDFQPYLEKYSIADDKHGNTIYLGDIVKYRNQKYIVVYRYGDFVLIKPGTSTSVTFRINSWNLTERVGSFVIFNEWESLLDIKHTDKNEWVVLAIVPDHFVNNLLDDGVPESQAII